MKNLVTNPQEIERLAEELEDENWEFRVWIKSSMTSMIRNSTAWYGGWRAG